MIRGLRAAMPAVPNTDPVFQTVAGGLGHLVERLAAALPDARVNTAVAAVEADGTGWRVDDEPFDAVIVTTPTYAAARLLAAAAPGATDAMARIEYASIALTLMAYPMAALGRPLDGSGFVVARDSGLHMTACSWASSKWAHLADDDAVILRVSAGRWGEEAVLDNDDADLVALLHTELERTMGMTAAPTSTQVVRWPLSFPQQTVGHLDRVSALEQSLRVEAPGLVVAGAGYRGLGLPACIGQAETAARQILRN
jgi:oxygen-dependent protoporphyrinogen oxidase